MPNIQLITDSDGIFPSGSYTTDTTPSFSWGTSGGTFFSISISSGSTFIVSGFVGTTQFTVPSPIAVGGYQVYLTVLGSTGSNLGNASGSFHITTWLRAPRTFVASDIVLANITDPSYIRYLPQWLAVQRSSVVSGSVLFGTLSPILKRVAQSNKDEEDILLQSSIVSTPVRLPRLWWHIYSPFSPRDTIFLSVSASGTSGTIRQVSSLYDFFLADDPVFIVGDTGHIGLRNIAQRTVTVSPSSGLYWIPGEGLGIFPDTDVFFTFPISGDVFRIPAGSVAIDPELAVIQLPPPFSGAITFTYQSKTFSSALTVKLSGGLTVAPFQSDLWNRFDELGLLSGLSRISNEDNKHLKERIYSRFLSRIGSANATVAQRLSQDLLLTTVVNWDGRSVLDLIPSGYYGVRRVDVSDFPQIVYVLETLTPGVGWEVSGSIQFFGSKGQWEPGTVIYVNGVVVDNVNYPGTSIDRNIVSFPYPVSGVVQVQYSYRNYDYTIGDAGFITQVIPVSGNLTSGNYTVVLTRNIRVFTTSDLQYQKDFLLTSNGLPNGEFIGIVTGLLETSPIHIGRSYWSRAYWAPQSEVVTPTEHLPTIFDFSSIVEC